MPTTRPRHTITETEPVAAALERARERWPGESDARLLRRLALAGAELLADEEEEDLEWRREAVRRHAGALEGCFGAGYRERLRSEWPD